MNKSDFFTADAVKPHFTYCLLYTSPSPRDCS